MPINAITSVFVEPNTLIDLGREGENNARQVVFDLLLWQQTYGAGGAELIVQRHGESSPYPVVLSVSGRNAIWNVTSADTAIPGIGEAELRYRVGDTLVKSEIWTTVVHNALGDAQEEAPEPAQGWLDQVLAAGSTAKQAAAEAKAEADRVVDEGSQQTANAKSQADAAALFADAAAKSAQQSEENAAKCVDLTEEVNQLKQDLTDLSVFVTPQMFGAKCDGASDDTEAVKTAIESGKPVYFPRGNYFIKDSLEFDNLSVKIVGDNATLASDGTTKAFLKFTNSSVELSGFTLDFQNHDCLYGVYCVNSYVDLKEISVKNIYDQDNTNDTIGIWLLDCDLKVDGVSFENIKKLKNGIIADYGGNANGLLCAYSDTGKSVSISNVYVNGLHNIDENDHISYEDTAGIYLKEANPGQTPKRITNVRGYEFGKRLVKLQCANVMVDGLYAESGSNDTLSAIGVSPATTNEGDGTQEVNVKISNVEAHGTMQIPIAISASRVDVSDIYIDTVPASLTEDASLSVALELFGNDINIRRGKFLSVNYIALLRGKGVRTDLCNRITIEDVVAENNYYNSSSGLFRLNHTLKGTVKDIAIRDVHAKVYHQQLFAMQSDIADVAFDGITIERVTYENTIPQAETSSGNSCRTMYIKNAKNVKISEIKAIYTGKADIGIEFVDCENVQVKNSEITVQSNEASGRLIRLNSVNGAEVKGCKGFGNFSYLLQSYASRNVITDIITASIQLHSGVNGIEYDYPEKVVTSDTRPADVVVGYSCFDKTINQTIVWNGSSWVVIESGYTPVKGTDYFTSEDKTELVEAVIDTLPKYDGGVS